MPVYVNETRITNQLDNTPVNWLLANIGEQILIEYDIEVKTFSINSTTSSWVLNNNDGYLGDGWVTGGDFSMFDIGDQIVWCNYKAHTLGGTFTIIDKLSNSEIQLSSHMGSLPFNVVGTEDVFSLMLPVTAMRYKWNFIENADPLNYFSKIDGTEQIALAPSVDASALTIKPMSFLGTLPYQIGSIEIEETGLLDPTVSYTDVYASKFTIRHTTRVTPLLLASQWDDYLNGIEPIYYNNTSCLKKVAFFEARYNNTDPNAVEVKTVSNVLGNSGFFDESYNTHVTNYYIENLSYTDSSATPVTLPKIQLVTGNDTLFQFDIRNTVNNPFSSGNTKLVLNFAKVPNDETEYQANGRDMLHNFVWEKVELTADLTPTALNGDNYSDSFLRSLYQVSATYISSDTIRVTGAISFLQDAVDVFNESNEPRYIMFVSIQDHTKTGAIADRVTLMADASPFYFQTLYPGLIAFDSKIIPHTENDFITPFNFHDTFSEDELVGYSFFFIQKNTIVVPKVITRITSKVIFKNTVTLEEFTVDSATLNTASIPFIGAYQYINSSLPRPFHIPSTEIRKNFLIRFDTVDKLYEVAFPYLNRWEYWKQLASANSSFFNVSEPNNGLNHNWVKYFTGDWKPYYVTEVAMNIGGVPQLYSDAVEYRIFDANLVDENISATIKTYDPDTLTELIDGSGIKYILGYKNTLVKATFTDSVNFLNSGNEVIVIGIEVFEEGGVTGKRRMSSKWPSDSDTWFLPLITTANVKNTQIASNILEGSCLVDFSQLNLSKLDWKLSARIYNPNNISEGTIGITDGFGYFKTQKVRLIPENPVDETPIPIERKQLDCCSDFIWRVLADATDSDKLKNDENSFLYWFNADAIDTAILKLVKSDGTEIDLTNNADYGTPYDYGFFINSENEKFLGYAIDWRKVLLTLGEDVYYIKVENTFVFGGGSTKLSDTYCLKQYTTDRADKTVRIEYYLNGLLGVNENDKKTRDLASLNWYNQHRFDGHFSYNKSTYKTEYIEYENGQSEWVEDEQNPEFIMELKSIPMFKHDVLRTDILQSDIMYVTDYNSSNIEKYYRKSVQKISEFAPAWNYMRSQIASLELRFKQVFNNHRKFRE